MRFDVPGAADRLLDFEPVPHRPNFAERHASLHHAERAGIHSQKHDALAAATGMAKISLVRAPRVIERIVNVRNRLFEPKPVHASAELPGRLD